MPMISRGTWITCISIRSSTAWSAAPRIGDGRALVRGRRAACTTLIGGMARPRIFALVNDVGAGPASDGDFGCAGVGRVRSEEHTSELQSLMRISYAVFCLTKTRTTI